jgi:hypothetical protein
MVSMASTRFENARSTIERLRAASPWTPEQWDKAELLADSLARASRRAAGDNSRVAQLGCDLGRLILREAAIVEAAAKGGAS